MKKTLLTVTVAAFLATPFAASAENRTVEDALKRREDLSLFYQGLLNTGILRELEPNTRYTVFAPTNEAFAEIPYDQYPCFYSSQCAPEVADILRNHIVPGEEYVTDMTNRSGNTFVGGKGGVYSMDGRFIAVGEPYNNQYTAGGKNIVSTNMLSSGILYKIDGVIANEYELATLQGYVYPVYSAFAPQPAYVVARPQVVIPADEVVVTKTERFITAPPCAIPGGCPDSVTTTVTTVYPDLYYPDMYAPLAPAAR